ncbi:hypothetical protein BI343_14820 [Chromobacterium amazonense]|nr:hypothetical protein BI343_14820 [Chromobacterium amazonense]
MPPSDTMRTKPVSRGWMGQSVLQLVQGQVGGRNAAHLAAGVLHDHGQGTLQHLFALHLVGVGLGDGVASALLGT